MSEGTAERKEMKTFSIFIGRQDEVLYQGQNPQSWEGLRGGGGVVLGGCVCVSVSGAVDELVFQAACGSCVPSGT